LQKIFNDDHMKEYLEIGDKVVINNRILECEIDDVNDVCSGRCGLYNFPEQCEEMNCLAGDRADRQTVRYKFLGYEQKTN